MGRNADCDSDALKFVWLCEDEGRALELLDPGREVIGFRTSMKVFPVTGYGWEKFLDAVSSGNIANEGGGTLNPFDPV